MENYSYDVLDIDKHLCFHIYATSREIIKIYRPYLEPLDLTYTQYITMMVLWKEKQLNVKELGIKLFLDSGTLTPVLKSLEAKGFVTRHRSTKDERVLIVELTEKGEELKKEAVKIPYSLAKQVNLTREEKDELIKLLGKALDPFRKEK
ncbi:MAG: MarR family transcriptional regulator [Clostridia bacterium]|nr:MarR family transcriptional regulator [Clostridia bacterium]MBR5903370.1 MarR family transcriptional regulator [Clostridia bacterium]